MTEALILFLIVFAVHLAPAFTPPTWPVLALYTLNGDLPLPVLVASAAIGAALGRLTLALAFRHFAHRLPLRLRGNLQAAHAAIAQRRHGRSIIFGLFLLGSKSAPLFEAAGLAGMRLRALTAVYLAGRLPRYSLYVLGAEQLGTTNFWESFRDTLTSPLGVAAQLLLVGLIIAFVRTDWSRWLNRER